MRATTRYKQSQKTVKSDFREVDPERGLKQDSTRFQSTNIASIDPQKEAYQGRKEDKLIEHELFQFWRTQLKMDFQKRNLQILSKQTFAYLKNT